MLFIELPDGRIVADTLGMAAVTHRKPATIRHRCRGIREPAGYDVAAGQTLLTQHKGETIALSAAEAEQYLGIPANRIYQWVFRQQLTPVDRVGRSPRYALDDLQRLVERGDLPS